MHDRLKNSNINGAVCPLSKAVLIQNLASFFSFFHQLSTDKNELSKRKTRHTEFTKAFILTIASLQMHGTFKLHIHSEKHKPQITEQRITKQTANTQTDHKYHQ